MKKTPAILMTTALLSVPCAEGATQKVTATNSPIIKTALMRTTLNKPCKRVYYEIVYEFSSSPYLPDDINDELLFQDDLGYDSLAFVQMLVKLEDELTKNDFSIDNPTYSIPMDDIMVGHVWNAIVKAWEDYTGEQYYPDDDC